MLKSKNDLEKVLERLDEHSNKLEAIRVEFLTHVNAINAEGMQYRLQMTKDYTPRHEAEKRLDELSRDCEELRKSIDSTREFVEEIAQNSTNRLFSVAVGVVTVTLSFILSHVK